MSNIRYCRVLTFSTTKEREYHLYINNDYRGIYTMRQLLLNPHSIVKHAIQLMKPHNPEPVAIKIGDASCLIEPKEP